LSCPFAQTRSIKNVRPMTSLSVYHRRRQHGARKRLAYSLLEVVMASGICASALVPALAVMRDGMALGEIIDTRHLLLLYGVSKMEEQLAVVGATWATGTVTGNFASDGQSSIRYSVTRSDSAANGGITNQLMNVSVTTFNDANGNGVMDTGEARLTFTTKVAKLVSYATKAGS
ncbi:MAG TPA: hypothetical protein VHU84_03005, partial [Lacipirellulaceae bacterium]|nr:hypothetical protein [Lacipirellulaceae bacterium]